MSLAVLSSPSLNPFNSFSNAVFSSFNVTISLSASPNLSLENIKPVCSRPNSPSSLVIVAPNSVILASFVCNSFFTISTFTKASLRSPCIFNTVSLATLSSPSLNSFTSFTNFSFLTSSSFTLVFNVSISECEFINAPLAESFILVILSNSSLSLIISPSNITNWVAFVCASSFILSSFSKACSNVPTSIFLNSSVNSPFNLVYIPNASLTLSSPIPLNNFCKSPFNVVLFVSRSFTSVLNLSICVCILAILSTIA